MSASKRLPVRRRLCLLAAIVAAICCLPAPALAAGPTSDFFGVNPGDLFRLAPSQWDAHLNAIAADGVQVVRLGAWWSDLEPGPPVNGRHSYAWGDVDQQVAALARHGLRWEPLLCFSATWGSKIDGDYNAAPDGPDNFAAFAAALAKRYGPNGDFWSAHPDLHALPVTAYEVWNEENAKLYWHPSTPEEYADLYAATRSAVHQVDGGARVVVGGLAAADHDGVIAPADFLRRMYAHRPDLRGAVDAVGLHPYASDPRGVYAKVAAFRKDLDAIAGPGVPLELTEIGWTTTDVSEVKRAAYLGEVAATLSHADCGIERLSAYDWLGPEQDSGDREQWFGIANRDGSQKPAAIAYAASVRLMRGLAGVAPTATAGICSGSAPQATTASAGRHKRLKLAVKVRGHRRGGRVRVRTRCSASCRLRVVLRVPRRASAARTIHVAKRSGRHQTLSFHVDPRVHRVRVKVTATARNGRHATRSRTVRLSRG